MVKHDARLIDPSPGEVADALRDAAAATNAQARTRLVPDDPAKWRKFARAAAASPEGFDLFRGGRGGVPASAVVGAWWTDYVGRKHVVLRGRRVESEDANVWLDRDALAARPPLWHAYPDRVCRRHLAGGTAWVAACGCGAVGTPDSLGWMGECCGPCHDRRQEGGEADERPAAVYGPPFWSVAFDPTGNDSRRWTIRAGPACGRCPGGRRGGSACRSRRSGGALRSSAPGGWWSPVPRS